MVLLFYYSVYVLSTGVSSLSTNFDIGGDKIRAVFSANILRCFYNSFTGIFDFELLWQSGNSIETLSNVYKDIPIPNSWDISLRNTFNKTDEVVDNCFDDNQWWLIGWISAYELHRGHRKGVDGKLYGNRNHFSSQGLSSIYGF